MARQTPRGAVLTLFATALALTLSFAPLPAHALTAEETYEKANDLYESGEYPRALNLYANLVGEKQFSSDVFYNLGNAFAKTSQPGEAVLWYRRALILDPRMTEARQNLQFLRGQLGYLEFQPKGLDAFVDNLTAAEWWALAFTAGWLALLCATLALTLPRFRESRVGLFILCGTALVVAIASGLAANRYQDRLSTEAHAVVTAPGTAARVSPVPDAAPVIDLPLGSTVRILTDRDAWLYVDIPGDVRGWIHADTAQPLWPVPPPDSPIGPATAASSSVPLRAPAPAQ